MHKSCLNNGSLAHLHRINFVCYLLIEFLFKHTKVVDVFALKYVSAIRRQSSQLNIIVATKLHNVIGEMGSHSVDDKLKGSFFRRRI